MIGDSESLSSRTALVLYGTETGTSQDLAYEASRILERHYFETDVDEFDNNTPQSLAQYAIVVFVLSTTGQGDFPANARRFWSSLLRKRLTSSFLAGVEYALVGLGDSSYPKFNWAARKLEKRIRQLGAESLLEPCEADEQGEDSTDGAFILWSQSFASMLQAKYTLPDGVQPISDDKSLKSKWLLSSVEANGVSSEQTNVYRPNNQQVNGSLKTPDSILAVTLHENRRVTPTDHWQDVRLLKLRVHGRADYYPGDAIAIRPKNLSNDVEQILRLMQWEEVADKSIHCRLQKKTSRLQRLPDPSLINAPTFTLRQLLTENLDISAIPRRSFFVKIAQYTSDEMHRDRLLEFTDPQYLDEYYDYATRPRRSILEILQEFDSVKIPWSEAINVFPILRPRQFSVASGGLQKEGGTFIDLLVAIVKYKTIIKRIREGVCSKYLAQLPVGTTFQVILKTEGRFHAQDHLKATNHLLIGAGTGVAPLRALIQEKAMLGGSDSPATLIFGCRNESADYFFKEEWRELIDSHRKTDTTFLQVITAFSRDQKQKLYVQDRIREHGGMIKDLLLQKEATIIVCGSSGAMPKAIRQALVDILKDDNGTKSDGAYSEQDAEAFLAKLEKIGRYKQETW